MLYLCWPKYQKDATVFSIPTHRCLPCAFHLINHITMSLIIILNILFHTLFSSSVSQTCESNLLPHVGNRCVICQMEYKRGDRRITLPCKHAYHAGCGARWLSINKVSKLTTSSSFRKVLLSLLYEKLLTVIFIVSGLPYMLHWGLWWFVETLGNNQRWT